MQRLASELRIGVDINTAGCRGGEPALLRELGAWRRRVRAVGFPMPDILVVLIDANSDGAPAKKRSIADRLGDGAAPVVVVGCPEPYIERWMFADVSALSKLLGTPVPAPHGDPGSTDWKNLLGRVVGSAGLPVLTGPMELAGDLVEAFDLQRATNADRSLKLFVSELSGALRVGAP